MTDSSSSYHTGYDFSRENQQLILPESLREISGLTVIDANRIACVQDEKGIIFFYDLRNNSIYQEIKFGNDGDYEGIARVNDSIYVLRNDGVIFSIDDFNSDGILVESFNTGITAKKNEGLCYDRENNRLLIACKSPFEKDDVDDDLRVVFGFNLDSKDRSEYPVYTFEVDEVEQFATENKIIFPEKEKKKKKDHDENGISFRISEIGIHPMTGDLFVLSAKDHCLFIFDDESRLLHIELLDPVVFNKPEGLTFFENGDLLISNEAQDRHPTLLRFNYLVS